jgi:hypothetical protein
MKNLAKSLFFSALFLLSPFVYADNQETKDINYQNLSKRPYQQTPSNLKQDNKNFEGATLRNDAEASDKNFQVLRLNMLSKRPYFQKSSD